MFKTDLSVGDTVRKLMREEGLAFCWRGMSSNVIAVSVPVALTIFLTDMFIVTKHKGSVFS
jgi:hypothetical protein